MIFCEYASPMPGRAVRSDFDAVLMSSKAVVGAGFAVAAVLAAGAFAFVCAKPWVEMKKQVASTRTATAKRREYCVC